MGLSAPYRVSERADLSALPAALRRVVEAELEPGERVSWAGQPVPGRLARNEIPIVGFATVWTAFSLFWVAGASTPFLSGSADAGSILFPLFGVPFVLVGIALLSSPFWAWRRATRTAYVLTDRRAIVLSCGARGSVQVRSFEATALRDVQRTQHADGSGDVVLAIDRRSDGDGGKADHPVGFLAVRDAKAVEARVRALASERRTESPSGG